MKKYILTISRTSFVYLLFVGVNTFVKFVIYTLIIYVCNPIGAQISLIFLVSLIVRSSMIRFYDYTETDWFLIEKLKSKKGRQKDSIVTRKIRRFKKIGEISLFIFLIFTDPVWSVLYYRPGNQNYNGLDGYKTKLIFILSNLVCVSFAWIELTSFIYLVT